MDIRRSMFRAVLLVASTAITGSAFGQALGPWMAPNCGGQDSADPTAVPARATIGAATGGVGHTVSFGHDSINRIWTLNEGQGCYSSMLGYYSNNPLAAVSWGPGNASVFYSAQDPYNYKNLYVRTWNGGSNWSWTDLGGDIAANERVAVATGGVGHMVVFVRKTNNKLYVKSYTNGWQTSWDELGNNLSGDPVAAYMGPGKLVVCAYRNNAMQCKLYQNGSWGGWITALNLTITPVSYRVVSTYPGQFTLLTPDAGGSQIIARRWHSGAFEQFSYVTGIPGNAKLLDAISRGGGGINVVWREYSTYTRQSKTYEMGYPLQHAWSPDGAVWQNLPVSNPTPALGAVLVSPAPNRVDLFADKVFCTVLLGEPLCMHDGALHIYAIGDPSPPPTQHTDQLTLTVGDYYGEQWGYDVNLSIGALSPNTTGTGKTYTTIREFWDWEYNPQSTMAVCGFSVDPGKDWLTSISVGTTTTMGAWAYFYQYQPTSGCGHWTWSSAIGLPAVGQQTQVTVVHY